MFAAAFFREVDRAEVVFVRFAAGPFFVVVEVPVFAASGAVAGAPVAGEVRVEVFLAAVLRAGADFAALPEDFGAASVEADAVAGEDFVVGVFVPAASVVGVFATFAFLAGAFAFFVEAVDRVVAVSVAGAAWVEREEVTRLPFSGVPGVSSGDWTQL